MALWILIGGVAVLAVALATGLAVAAVLGAIGTQVSDLLDEQWSSAPLTSRRR
jgi:hypothetical protein